MLRFILIVSVFLFLTACGTKGALTLPSDKSEEVKTEQDPTTDDTLSMRRLLIFPSSILPEEKGIRADIKVVSRAPSMGSIVK